MNTAVTYADIYLRLSIEEANNGESGSIINQRNILHQYCKANNITIVKEFVDDGFSGSNFDRPGFKAMLKHIDTGLVSMVLTKDLSRLGRDMTESSYYAETYFPEHSIRYIAISDGFDSTQDNLMAPFNYAMNEVYLRDTSRKIKQVLNYKRESGEYCACPPFGYMKNPDGSKSLVPDPNTAPIVQHIFELAAEGKSAHFIADLLTEEGQITPLKYRVLYRDNFCDKGAARATDKWNHTTVKRILKNQVYLGNTVLGKTKKASFKSKKKLDIAPEDWVVHYNTHTPLVTQEQFDNAAHYMGINTKNWAENDRSRISVFNGLVFCENCGAAMCSCGSVYNGEREKYWYLSCQNIPKRSRNHCENGARIRYADLVEIVKSELNQFIDLSKSYVDEIIDAAIKKSRSKVYQDSSESTEGIENRLREINGIIEKLYNDNSRGLITDEQLSDMLKARAKETKNLKERLAKLNSQKVAVNDISGAYKEFFSLIDKYNHIEELTPEIVRTFIERIEIGKKELPEGYTVATHDIPYKQNIKIYYRFIGSIGEKSREFNQNLQDVIEHPEKTKKERKWAG
ncbi:MAG: recombinase family protein [Clostridia bacterium]|nr:recombinase family protein [Clostridia bacterium]